MASERLQGEKQVHSKNYLLEMPRFHAKMRLKSTPQKLSFFNGKSYSSKIGIFNIFFKRLLKEVLTI